jgi:MFS family permease
VPGLLLAVWIRLTVKEPRRGQSEATAAAFTAPPQLLVTLRSFLRIPSLRHIPLAGALHGLGAFGAAVWVPAYFMRSHSMSSFEIGKQLAVLMGSVGLAGAVLGGFWCDRLVSRSRNARWYMWIPGTALLLSIPFLLLAFSTSRPGLALLFYAVPVFCNHIVLGPIVASMQALVGVNRRATVAAFYLFMVNLIAMGLGPLVIGVFSDLFHARYGTGALQYSLMTLTAVTCGWASLHLFLASRTITADLQRSSAD